MKEKSENDKINSIQWLHLNDKKKSIEQIFQLMKIQFTKATII